MQLEEDARGLGTGYNCLDPQMVGRLLTLEGDLSKEPQVCSHCLKFSTCMKLTRAVVLSISSAQN